MKKIESCELSLRAITTLKAMGFETEEQLKEYWKSHHHSFDNLKVYRNFGRYTHAEVLEYSVQHFKN